MKIALLFPNLTVLAEKDGHEVRIIDTETEESIFEKDPGEGLSYKK